MQFAFLRTESYKKGILFSGAFNFVSRLLLFAQSVIVAYYFGTEDKTDVFFYCFTTVTLIAYFVNSLDSSVLIPEAMRLREQENEEESIKFLNSFIYLYFMIGLISAIVFLLYPIEAFQLFSKFDVPVLEKNIQIILLSIPLFGLMITTNLLVNILASYKFFTLPMIVSTINNGVALICLFTFHDSLNIVSLLLGLLLAYTFNIVFLCYLMRKNLNWNFAFRKSKIRFKVFRNIFFAQVGNFSSVLTSYVPMYLLSGFNAGTVSALMYGQKTSEIPNQLISLQFLSVVGIKFNELYAVGDFDGVNRVFSQVAKIMIFILIPLSMLMFLFGENIIAFLYKRGTFNMESTIQSTSFFKCFVLTLPFMAINALFARVFMSSQKIIHAFIYQSIFNLLFVSLTFMGIREYGAIGYPLSAFFIYFLNVLGLYWLSGVLFPWLKYFPVLLYFLKALIINGLISGVIILLMRLSTFERDGFLNLLIGSSVYFTILLIINFYFDFNGDVNQFIKK